MSVETRLAETAVEEGKSVALVVDVRNRSEEGQPMTLAVVGIPANSQRIPDTAVSVCCALATYPTRESAMPTNQESEAKEN